MSVVAGSYWAEAAVGEAGHDQEGQEEGRTDMRAGWADCGPEPVGHSRTESLARQNQNGATQVRSGVTSEQFLHM